MKARVIGLFLGLCMALQHVHAQKVEIKSFRVREGVLITKSATPFVFIFRAGGVDERMEYDPSYFLRTSAVAVNLDVLPGLRWWSARLTPDRTDLDPEDRKLAEEQLPKEGRDKMLVFTGVDGRLFYLPKDGETPVIRVDLVVGDNQRVTLWTRRQHAFAE